MPSSYEGLSPKARFAANTLYELIAAGEDPTVVEARQLSTVQILQTLLGAAAALSVSEATAVDCIGALLAGFAWIAERHAEFVPPRGKQN